MLIHIENYRNIDLLDLEIEDKKPNYLFGVCGSGKSSIVLATSKERAPSDTTIGKDPSETIVQVNGADGVMNNVRVYNAEEQQAIFLNNSPSYRQKAINFRLLCDLRKSLVGQAWGYSSMILHGYSKMEIEAELSRNETTEEQVLVKANTALGVKMSPMPDNLPKSADTDGLSDFEKLIEARELIDAKTSEEDKLYAKMLNDLVHMNDATAYCLNPYKFQVWSPELAKILA